MPAQRLPWIKFWPEAVEHEKFACLTDAESWSWVVIWSKASLQPTRWRFASAEHARHVTGRPAKHVQRLIEVGLLEDGPEGLVIHDAKYWQDASNIPPRQRERPTKGDRKVSEHAGNGERRVIPNGAKGDLEGEGDIELNPPTPLPGGGRRTVPKPKPERKPLTEQDTEALVSKYAERYGTPQAVRDEIELALNHQARLKNFDERIYVGGWLRRELTNRPSRLIPNGRTTATAGHVPHVIDRTGVQN